MNEQDEEIYRHEYEKGEQAMRCMEYFIQPFFDEKTKQLFDGIFNLPFGDTKTLEAIHHQMKSLNALRIEIQTFIDTGKMAEMSLIELRKKPKKV